MGYTTGAGYQIWVNQAHFREDLQVYIAQNLDWRAPIDGPVSFDQLAAIYANPDAPLFHALRWAAIPTNRLHPLAADAIRRGFQELSQVVAAALDIKDKTELRDAAARLVGQAVLAKAGI